MNLEVLEAELYAATDKLWITVPDTPDEPTKVVMYDQLVAYINKNYPDPCVRDALVFATDEYFAAESELLTRDLDTSAGSDLDLARRGSKKWRKFVKKVIHGTQKIIDKVEEGINHVVGELVKSTILTQSVCGSLSAVVGGTVAATGAGTGTAPAVGSVVYYWCLDEARKLKEKDEAGKRVFSWKGKYGGITKLGTGDSDMAMIERPNMGDF
jgi:hypothetical protein